MSMRGNANLLEEYLKVNYMWLRRLCKSKDFRARLSFNLALVWGVALAETSRYLYNLVQTQAGPSTVRAILRDLSAVARLHLYSPTQDEQAALSSTLGQWGRSLFLGYSAFYLLPDGLWLLRPLDMPVPAPANVRSYFFWRIPVQLAAAGATCWASSNVSDMENMRRILELPDSRMAGEAAAILLQRRPDAWLGFMPDRKAELRIARLPAPSASEALQSAGEFAPQSRTRSAGGGAAPAQPPTPDGLFDGVFGAAPPAVVATGGAARGGDPLADPGEAWDPWDTVGEENRPAEAAAGGPPSRRRDRLAQRRARREQGGDAFEKSF